MLLLLLLLLSAALTQGWTRSHYFTTTNPERWRRQPMVPAVVKVWCVCMYVCTFLYSLLIIRTGTSRWRWCWCCQIYIDITFLFFFGARSTCRTNFPAHVACLWWAGLGSWGRFSFICCRYFSIIGSVLGPHFLKRSSDRAPLLWGRSDTNWKSCVNHSMALSSGKAVSILWEEHC